MQPKRSISRIAIKELTLFFASPIAWLFLGVFAAVTLFVFFWGEAFFARNIADVRPLFEWMPLLLIFLASTLTMRLWSEERRTGTLEHVLTQSVPLWHFVLGKFLACLALLVIALATTLPLPITVSMIADIDWGPVWAGYLAAMLLGAAYLSIGLFVSSRSNNQIVSLIVSVALCSVFYLIGSRLLTDLVSHESAELLRSLGTGSRFDAITRGVIDIHDFYYYLSLVLVFLALNTFALERERWAKDNTSSHHRLWGFVTLAFLANALVANLWLSQMQGVRWDVTAGKQYSLSDATREYLKQLQEPMLIRGYFSNKTHPLLSPLVPQLRDLIQEYAHASQGRLRVEFIDPANAPELEEEAAQKYSIQPTPFQVADRYQAAVVNSYFDVLVQYGDEHQVLGFRDLIEVKSLGEADLKVRLRNPEHDLTRAIKKVIHAYQAGGNLFDTIDRDLQFTGYVSAEDKLPEQLRTYRQQVVAELEKLQELSNGRLNVSWKQPETDAASAQWLQDMGLAPMATSLFSQDYFYFYLILSQGDQHIQIPLEDMSQFSFERNLNAAIRRFSRGFTKTLALVTPSSSGFDPMTGMSMSGPQFNQLERFLGAELNVIRDDLSKGWVNGQADVLMLMAPSNLSEKQLFAVDQFLMQGGTVILATSPYAVQMSQRNLSLTPHTSGLEDWLKHQGLVVEKQLVMDPQNSPFPMPVTRSLGGFSVQEVHLLDYPYFADIRAQGLNQENPISAGLPQLTFAWGSPIQLQKDRLDERKVTELLHSSSGSWLSSSTQIMPGMEAGRLQNFQPSGERGEQLLGVILEGRFDSWFADRQSPLLAGDAAEAEETTEDQTAEDKPFTASSVIRQSPESARLILFSSNDFASDQVMRIASSIGGSEYLNAIQLMANSVDWALEDAGLLSIRARGHFNRTLPGMETGEQRFWEYLNYGLSLLAILLLAGVYFYLDRSRRRRYQALLASV